MSIDLPTPIAAYFTADRSDSDGIAGCFTDHAVVLDEGRTHSGRAAIRDWKAGTARKYVYTCEPFAADEQDGETIVTCRLTGNFPGSPVDLRFFFRLDGDKIASLRIMP